MIEFILRHADSNDCQFLEYTYTLTQKPLLQNFLGFDEEDFLERFKKLINLNEVRIIVAGSKDIGWIQITNKQNAMDLAQIHLLESYRNQLIGTAIIGQVQREAAAAGKVVTLAVVKGNPAFALYKRLGFKVTKEDDKKRYMTWTPGRQ